MKTEMFGPLMRETGILDAWSASVVKEFSSFVEINKDVPFIEDILVDCDHYGTACADVKNVVLASGTQEHQADIVHNINMLMFAAYNMGRHQGTLEHIELRPKEEGRRALREHLARAREVLTPVNDIKREVVKQKTKSLWERKSEYIDNIRGTAFVIMKSANEEIRKKCKMLGAEERGGAPDEDLKLSAMMKWVRRAQAALEKEGRFTRL